MTTATTARRRGERRDEILQVLASMLQQPGNERITTANLAAKVGVSEAALYRHFPSKAKMFDALLDFIEETLFSRLNAILDKEPSALEQLPRIANLYLAFIESNPGISRVLSGHALAGEDARLVQRSAQIQARLETSLKQMLRKAELEEGLRMPYGLGASANLVCTWLEGRLAQFVRSEFRQKPTELWEDQWMALSKSLFRLSVPTSPT